jgi:hypothetical protein
MSLFFKCFKNDNGCEVLVAVTLKNTIFHDVIPWSLVEDYQHIRGTFAFIFTVEV